MHTIRPDKPRPSHASGERVEPLDLLLDDAVAGMREGEVCRLAPIPHELTASTDAVPLGAELRYTVALLSLERGRQVWEMEGRELLCLARQDKERGTQLFKEQRERDAAASYSRAAKLAIAATGDEPDVPELLVTLYLNLAACQLKLRQNGHAFENSSRVLAVKPGCVKALYRRGVAAMSLGDLETAESDLTAAEKVEPGNRSVQSKLREVKRLLHIQTSSLSQALRPMFSPSS